MNQVSAEDEFFNPAHDWLRGFQGDLFSDGSLCASVDILDTEIKSQDDNRKTLWVDVVMTFVQDGETKKHGISTSLL
ncbi:hypothetical protein LC593_23425 [Nostoc sp. CHAB 5844]|nr:hypothetical protein [Nostoc sp. CHAB 5844]